MIMASEDNPTLKSPYSPGWKRPSDVMKVIRRRSSTPQLRDDRFASPSANLTRSSPTNNGAECVLHEQGGKRKNPFSSLSQPVKRLSQDFKEELGLQSGISKKVPKKRAAKVTKRNVKKKPVSKDIVINSKTNDSVFTRLEVSEDKANKESDVIQEKHSNETLGDVSKLEQKILKRSFSVPAECLTECLQDSGTVTNKPRVTAECSDISADKFTSDWKLRTRVRFTSSRPFDWCHPLSSTDEAEGVRRFLSDSSSSSTESVSDVRSTEVRREFYRNVLYFIHPHLPWLQLFPRHIIDTHRTSANAAWTNSEDVLRSLQESWSDSVTSAYQNIRTGTCPFVYLCAQHLTILFHAQSQTTEDSVSQQDSRVISPVGSERVSSRVAVRAVVTPTSRGLREALKNEGIEFTMPLINDKEVQSNKSVGSRVGGSDDLSTALSESLIEKQDLSEMFHEETKTRSRNKNDGQNLSAKKSDKSLSADHIDHDDSDDDDVDYDESAGLWLEELGLDRKKYKSLDPTKIKDEKDIYKRIDYRPESTLVVKPRCVNALFNYVINTPACLASTSTGSTGGSGGGLLGVPPTILSPVAFRGSTLQALKVHDLGSVRQQTAGGSSSSCYMLELSGPVLPHCLTRLTRLLSRTQSGDVRVTSSVHEPSAALDALTLVLDSDKTNDLNCSK